MAYIDRLVPKVSLIIVGRELMCHSETSVCGHQLPLGMDASLRSECGHIRVTNFLVLVLKCDSQ
jgi:hypothetical protein